MPRRLATSALAMLLAAAVLAVPAAQARNRYDVKLLAKVPPPGYPALSYVGPDRTIYVSTFIGPNSTDAPATVFSYRPGGAFIDSYTINGENGSQNGVQAAAMDARGLLYLLDQHPPRVVILNPITRDQQPYATFKNVPQCMPPGSGGDCSDTVMDNEPEPNYAAWGPDGSLYVTDYIQGLIWRVPPGGGEAHVWFTDPRLDAAQFGPAGIELMPDHRTLMLSTSAGPVAGPNATTGKIYKLPIQPDGKPGQLQQLWESGPGEGPDGFALARSGNIYLALVGPNVNQLVVLSPSGQEITRISHDVPDSPNDVPFDSPSSVRFDGDRLIVTNDAYFTGTASHWAIFDVFAGEQGQPIYVPPRSATPAPAGGTATRPAGNRYLLRISSRKLRAGHRVRMRFSATVSTGGAKASAYRRARVRIAGRTVRTNRRGRAALSLTFPRPGRYTVRLLPPRGRRTLAKTSVRVK